MTTKDKLDHHLTGRIWYTNGKVEIRSYYICPEGFKPGRLPSSMPDNNGRKRKAWNDGLSKENDDRLKKIGQKIGQTYWFTDGQNNVRKVECPEGFWPGRTKITP